MWVVLFKSFHGNKDLIYPRSLENMDVVLRGEYIRNESGQIWIAESLIPSLAKVNDIVSVQVSLCLDEDSDCENFDFRLVHHIPSGAVSHITLAREEVLVSFSF